MGFISWIKDRYYEFHYRNAIDLIKSNNISEAECCLKELLNKHPKAIAGLARIYRKQGASAEENAALACYNKAYMLKDHIEQNFQYDSLLYNRELKSISQEIELRADKLFNTAQYELCLSYLDYITCYNKIEAYADTLFNLGKYEKSLAYLECIKSSDKIEMFADKLYISNQYELAIKFLNSVACDKKTDTNYIEKLNKYKLFLYLNNAYQQPTTGKAIDTLSLHLNKILGTVEKCCSEVFAFCKEKASTNNYCGRSLEILTYLYPDTELPIEMLSQCYVQCVLGKDHDTATGKDVLRFVTQTNINIFYQSVTTRIEQLLSTRPLSALEVCRTIINKYTDCSKVYFAICQKLLAENKPLPEEELLSVIKQLPSQQKQLDVCKRFIILNTFKATYYETLSDLVLSTFNTSGSISALKVLERYWDKDNSLNIFENLLNIENFKYELLDFIIRKSSKYLMDISVTNLVLCFLEKDHNIDYVIEKLEIILDKLFAADLYEKRILSIPENISMDDKLSYYDRALSNINSEKILQKKLELIWDYVEANNLEKSLQILKEVAAHMPVSAHVKEQLCNKYYRTTVSCVLNLFNTGGSEKAIACLESRWKEKYPRNIFSDLLGLDSFREPLLTYIIENGKKYIFSQEVLETICNTINALSSYDFALTLIEKLKEKGFDVKKYYVSKINSVVSTLSIEEKEILLDRAISVYKDSQIVSLRSALLLEYFDQNKIDQAFRIANEMQALDKSVLYDLCYVNIKLSTKSLSALDERTKYLSDAEQLWLELSDSQSGRYSKKQLRKQINNATLMCAKDYEQSGNIAAAVSLVSCIISHYSEAINEIARIFKEHLVKEEIDSTAIETRCCLIKEAITQLKKLPGDLSNDKNYIALWHCLVRSTLLKFQNIDVNDEYEEELTDLWNKLQLCNLSSEANDFSNNLLKELSKVKKELAIKYEKTADLQNATRKYNDLKVLSGDLHSWATIRSLICIIKSSDKELIANNIKQIEKHFEKHPSRDLRELIYRYCIYMIKHGNYQDSYDIIKKYIPNELELASVCENHFIKIEESNLNDFNSKIESIRNKAMSSTQAKVFLKSFDTLLLGFSHIASISTEEQNRYKIYLENYIIYKLYSESKYEECYVALKKLHGDYINNMVSMRNLAIMSLEIAENKLLSNANYEEIISIWLTAIFDERIFVESLQQTHWDDQYTFTLKNAFGNYSEQDYGLLPANVSFKTPTTNVVEIRGVQTALMSRFEASLVDTPDFYAYYQSQKEAINLMISLNLDKRCRAYSPGIVKFNSQASSEVLNALNCEERQHYGNWEDVLKVACMYGFLNGIYGVYNTASDYLKSCKEALDQNNIRSIKTAFNANKIEEIKKFDELAKALNMAVYASFSNARRTMSVDRILSVFAPITKVLDDSQLNYSITNYINQEVIQRVNQKDISLAKASQMMLNAYNICPTNRTILQNLQAMTESLVTDYIMNGEDGALNVLVEILEATNEFHSAVISALKGDDSVPEELRIMLFATNEQNFMTLKNTISRYSSSIRITLNTIAAQISEINLNMQLNQIVEKVNNNTLSNKDALIQVYNLYLQNQSNERVCENLAIITKICIMEYIAGDKAGKQSVISTLDRLRNNRSATFNAHNSDISNTRREILNNMSYDTKQALLYHSDMLTAQGRALKLALDYLQYLS